MLLRSTGLISRVKIINGAPLSIVNPATLSNPDTLLFYADIGTTLRKEVDG